MTNQAIHWIRSQQSLTPDKPFFIYFATGATHAPHHVPKEWIAKFKGKFDGGWDKYREETLRAAEAAGHRARERQARRPSPTDIKDWDKLTADEKKLFARQMEVFAAFAAHTDHEIGRVVAGHRGHGRARQHADPLRGGRQRRQRRGRHGRHVQRDDLLQRRPGDGPEHAQEHRQVGRPRDLPAHGRGLGRGRQHAVHVDQAGRLQLRRHAQPAGDQLARAHQGQGRDPQPVPPRHRHRADRARGRRHPRAQDGQRRGADADGRRRA